MQRYSLPHHLLAKIEKKKTKMSNNIRNDAIFFIINIIKITL